MNKVGIDIHEKGDLLFNCPGCDEEHKIYIAKGKHPRPVWQWNNSLEVTTITPSIRVKGTRGLKENVRDFMCHSFITDGKIKFLTDCTHKLKGQTVELPEYKKENDNE